MTQEGLLQISPRQIEENNLDENDNLLFVVSEIKVAPKYSTDDVEN